MIIEIQFFKHFTRYLSIFQKDFLFYVSSFFFYSISSFVLILFLRKQTVFTLHTNSHSLLSSQSLHLPLIMPVLLATSCMCVDSINDFHFEDACVLFCFYNILMFAFMRICVYVCSHLFKIFMYLSAKLGCQSLLCCV